MKPTFARITLMGAATVCCFFLMGCSRSRSGNISVNRNQSPTPARHIESPTGPTAKQLKLYPVDEALKDSSLVAFRQQLISAVDRKDHQFIRSILDPKIVVSFGGDAGIQDFFKFWKPERPESALWEELATILSMGGSFEVRDGEPAFWAPYVFSTWDSLETQLKEADDVFTHSAIVAENVEMKANPDAGAAVVGLLNYDVVKVDDEKSVRESGKDQFVWVNVTTVDGRTGYVAGNDVRSPIDYRACFEKKGNRWLMTALVAGD